ncbi:hypothetical protein [Brachyspira intermedia]|uniref:hypothetical protein n=1 Tax=Brachyspira intermedia TaxID=84377 RepID=UPI003006A944
MKKILILLFVLVGIVYSQNLYNERIDVKDFSDKPYEADNGRMMFYMAVLRMDDLTRSGIFTFYMTFNFTDSEWNTDYIRSDIEKRFVKAVTGSNVKCKKVKETKNTMVFLIDFSHLY